MTNFFRALARLFSGGQDNYKDLLLADLGLKR